MPPRQIGLTEQLNLEQIRVLLTHSTPISKQGLVEVGVTSSAQSSQNLDLCFAPSLLSVGLNNLGMAQVSSWQLQLDPRLGVVISKVA